MIRRLQFLTASCGLLAVSVFVSSFVLFSCIHPDFDAMRDYISKLGGLGQPNAIFWNIVGFGAVGILLSAFGWLFGLCRNDRVLGACLLVAGVGFSLAAIPTDFSEPKSPQSAAHFASVCLSLAGFCLGLARLTGPWSTDYDRKMANWVVGLAVLPIICCAGGVSAEPVAHRVILLVVFTWVVLNSMRLLRIDFQTELVG